VPRTLRRLHDVANRNTHVIAHTCTNSVAHSHPDVVTDIDTHCATFVYTHECTHRSAHVSAIDRPDDPSNKHPDPRAYRGAVCLTHIHAHTRTVGGPYCDPNVSSDHVAHGVAFATSNCCPYHTTLCDTHDAANCSTVCKPHGVSECGTDCGSNVTANGYPNPTPHVRVYWRRSRRLPGGVCQRWLCRSVGTLAVPSSLWCVHGATYGCTVARTDAGTHSVAIRDTHW
jgi:hypothetical protein